MKQIKESDEEIDNSNKQQVPVIKELTRIPSNHENAAGYYDAKQLGKAMEQEIAVNSG